MHKKLEKYNYTHKKLERMSIERDNPFYYECIVNHMPFIDEDWSLVLLLLEKIYLYIKKNITCITSCIESLGWITTKGTLRWVNFCNQTLFNKLVALFILRGNKFKYYAINNTISRSQRRMNAWINLVHIRQWGFGYHLQLNWVVIFMLAFHCYVELVTIILSWFHWAQILNHSAFEYVIG